MLIGIGTQYSKQEDSHKMISRFQVAMQPKRIYLAMADFVKQELFETLFTIETILD